MSEITTKFIIFPFATGGSRTAVPNDEDPSGVLSWEEGFSSRYSLNKLTDPNALPVPRTQTNQIYFDLSTAIQQYQVWGTPNFITTADNEGVAYPYDKWAYALYDDGTNGLRPYQSLVPSNSTLPTSILNWRVADNNAASLNYNAVVFEGTVVDGNIVYFNSGTSQYTKAVANGTAAQNAIGFADVTNGRIIAAGECTLLSGLTSGGIYYLSPTTPGAITTSVPPSGIVQVGTAVSTTEFLVNIVSDTAVVPNVLASMYGSTRQTVSTAGPVVLNFNTVEFDSYSLCNTTSHTITVNLTGKWEFTAVCKGLLEVVASGSADLGLYKNGTLIKTIGILSEVGAVAAIQNTGILGCSVIVSATAGDVFDIRVSLVGVPNTTLDVFIAAAVDSSFQAEFLGA